MDFSKPVIQQTSKPANQQAHFGPAIQMNEILLNDLHLNLLLKEFLNYLTERDETPARDTNVRVF